MIMPTVKELKECLDNYYQDDQVIAFDIWCTDDLYSRADKDYVARKDPRLEEALHRMHAYKDATIGLNWDVADAALQAGALPLE